MKLKALKDINLGELAKKLGVGEPTLLDIIKEQDPRIKVLHKENGGISSARNIVDFSLQTDFFIVSGHTAPTCS